MQRLIGAAFISLGLFSPSVQAAEPAVPATTFTVGAGVAVLPEYAGGDDFRTAAVIAVDYQHASGFFASTRRGLGYQTQVGAFGLSTSIGYDGGRLDRKQDRRAGSDTLRGMGDIPGALTANLGLSYALDGGVMLGYRAVLALRHREKGNHHEFTVQAPVVRSEQDKVSLFAAANYGDSKYMQTWYGVSAAQSLATGQKFRQYTTSAGFDKFGLGVNWQRKINDKWSLNSSAGVMLLMGDAADSPLTKKKAAPMLSTTLNYAF